jgi:hypothetical protein
LGVAGFLFEQPATLELALAAERNITNILELMIAENADPAYIATQRRIAEGFESIRNCTFSCLASDGCTTSRLRSFKEFEMVPLENPGVPGGAGPADVVVNIEYRR